MIKRLATLVLALGINNAAVAHSWYPTNCCSNDDCAPVISIVRLPDGNYEVTTKVGTTLLYETQTILQSEDDKYHACMIPVRTHDDESMRFQTNDYKYNHILVCFFAPTLG